MARKNAHSYERRKREQDRQARAAARRERKRNRSGNDPSEPDLVEDPVYAQKPSDDEVQAAIERAMNPGGMRRRAPRENSGGGGDEHGGRGGSDGPRRLFVGNLSFDLDEDELRAFFDEQGFKLQSARLIRDRETGRPRGFAFVDLGSAEEAQKAIDALNGMELAGRALRINAADER